MKIQSPTLTLISKMIFISICLLQISPVLWAQSISLEPNLSKTHDMTIVDNGDGSFLVNTSGGDPWVLSKNVSSYDYTTYNVLSFEYKSTTGLDDLEVFFGPPIQAGYSIKKGAVASTDTWTTLKIFFEYETNLWNKAYTSFRFDFGKKAGQSITFRNAHLRPIKEEDQSEVNQLDAFVNDQFLTYLNQDYASQIEEVSVTGDKVVISGRVDNSESNLYLCEVKSWQYGFTGEVFEHIWPLNGTGNFSQEVDQMVSDNGKQNDRIYSRWVLAKKVGDGFELKSHMKFPTDVFNAAQDYPVEDVSTSVKGMGGVASIPGQFYDLVDLGVQNITINVVLPAAISLDPTSLSHDLNGKTYYFNESWVNSVDNRLIFCAENDIVPTFILLIPVNLTEAKRDWFVHPDATEGIYALPNLNSQEGMEYYAATMDFLAQRYSREDEKYGRVSRFIMHNEVDAHYVWTDAGDKPMPLYTELYQRSARMVYYTARKYNPNAKVLISLTKHWTQPLSPQAYKPAESLALWNDLGKKQGDFEWGVAYHPYPEDLREPEVWNNTAITYDFNTPQITGKNVEVMDAWMRKTENLFKGQKVRTLQFSEQGVNTRDNSAEQQNIQAAGVAYYWKKVKDLPALEAFQYHRWVDHPNEGGLQFGLWANAENTTQNIGEKKSSWEVYQSAGTGDEADIFENYKSIIGIDNWSEIRKTIPTDVTPYTIDFVVKGEGKPVVDAVVEFSGTKQKTDESGKARFYNVASLPEMPYVVRAPDYVTATGQLDVTGDEEIVVNFVTTGIEDIPEGQWQIYPNPVFSGHSLHVIFPDWLKETRLSIYDMSGKAVLSRSYKSGIQATSLRIDFEPGVYVVELNSGDGRVFKKLVVE